MPLNSEWPRESVHGLRYNLYYVCCIFDISQGHSVEGRPTQAFEFSKRRRRLDGASGTRPGGDACKIHSLRFQTGLHTWLSWLRRSLLWDALSCPQFESHWHRFYIFFTKLMFFLLFSIFQYFALFQFLFFISILHKKITKIFYSFYIYILKTFI